MDIRPQYEYLLAVRRRSPRKLRTESILYHKNFDLSRFSLVSFFFDQIGCFCGQNNVQLSYIYRILIKKGAYILAKSKRRTMKDATSWWILAVVVVVYLIYTNFFAPSPEPTIVEGTAEVSVIDVGQGDAILIRTNSECVLIDAGPASSKKILREYLVSNGVDSIDYAVFTHPHEDHIGGAAMIMSEFDIENVILPDVVHTSDTFENMINAIENSGATVHQASCQDEYNIGGIRLTVLAPISEEYDELNNYSVVIRMDYGETSFLFTGDAEAESESQMLAKHGAAMLDCDFYKVAHHGSTTSNTKEFLLAVSPDIAVISCEKGNSYGHPHKEVVAELTDMGIDIYRTDISGTLVFVTDGKEITAK